MSGDKQKGGNTPIAKQVLDGLKKAKRDKLKGELKGDFEALIKAQETVTNIVDKIEQKLKDAGESAEDIVKLLQDV